MSLHHILFFRIQHFLGKLGGFWLRGAFFVLAIGPSDLSSSRSSANAQGAPSRERSSRSILRERSRAFGSRRNVPVVGGKMTLSHPSGGRADCVSPVRRLVCRRLPAERSSSSTHRFPCTTRPVRLLFLYCRSLK